ncbi:type II secretion system protein [Allorhodopirellula solitaria]|uniref:type II secretion system protein n=1 Tax=Allorhodopirellula solitaria TaxID=2527987 RepID=UPI0011B7ECC9
MRYFKLPNSGSTISARTRCLLGKRDITKSLDFRRAGDCRKGLTIVELMVALAVIAILMAVLLPAVMRARSSARQISCINNFRQVSLGLQNYASAWRRFPPASSGVRGGCLFRRM